MWAAEQPRAEGPRAGRAVRGRYADTGAGVAGAKRGPGEARRAGKVVPGGAPAGEQSAGGGQAFWTKPERMQRVQALMWRTVPAMTLLTRWIFGRQTRLVALLAWLRLRPTRGRFPQTAHTWDTADLRDSWKPRANANRNI